jgi:mRNA interferase YafQ
MYQVKMTSKFKKDYKLAMKRGYNQSLLKTVITQLAAGEQMSEQYRDHTLSGNWSGYRECHVTPDWLLIYKLERDILVLTLTRTGTHSDLF